MRLWSALCVSLLLCSCHDRTYESPVPAGWVDYSCVLTTVNIAMDQGAPQVPLESQWGFVRCYDPQKRNLSDGWGTGGLLLVHSGFELNTFYAYDLACPQCYVTANSSASKIHRIGIASDGMTAVCPDCDSEFKYVFSGSPAPTAGPANQNNYVLRQYKASLVGDKLIVRK